MRSRHAKRALCVGVLLWLLVMGLADSATSEPVEDVQQHTLYVAHGESIQETQASCPSGTVILLAPGVYKERLLIEKSITLRGAAKGTTIHGGWGGSAIRVRGEAIRVQLEDITVEGATGFDGYGIQVEGSPVIDLCQITCRENAWGGLWVQDRAAVQLDNCRLQGNDTHGLVTQDFAFVTLRECTIVANGTHGIMALHVSDVLLDSCVIASNWSGVWAWDGVRLRAEQTVIDDNTTHGVVAQNGALIDLVQCSLSGNGGFGTWITDSGRGVLVDCEVRNNSEDGVRVERDGIIELWNCILTGNHGMGIRTGAPSCVGGFDPSSPFKGSVEGGDNVVPGHGEPDGNLEGSLCPVPASTFWPPGFRRNVSSGDSIPN